MEINLPPKERLLSLQTFNQLKFDHILPINHLGLPPKLIAYWRREGLLVFVERGGWAKVSCVDAMWLMVLNSVRSLGLGIDTMKKLTDYFLQRGHDENVAKQNLVANRNTLEKRKKLRGGVLDEEDQKALDDINATLNNDVLLYALRWDINYFSNLITYSTMSRTEVAILIFPDGQIVEQGLTGYRTFPEQKVDFSIPHVRLSMNYFLREFIDSKDIAAFVPLHYLFTKDEQAVLTEIKNKNVRKLEIILSDGEITRFDSSKEELLTGEKEKEVRRLMGLKDYESIKLDVRNKDTIVVQRTKKKKKN